MYTKPLPDARRIRDFEDKEIPLDIVHKLLAAGLKAPTNNHLRQWEFILVQDQAKREALVRSIHAPKTTKGSTKIVDDWGLTEPSQREVYIVSIPKQHSMILRARLPDHTVFLHDRAAAEARNPLLVEPFRLDMVLHRDILVAAAAEGIFGVTRIPFEVERKTLKRVLNIRTAMKSLLHGARISGEGSQKDNAI